MGHTLDVAGETSEAADDLDVQIRVADKGADLFGDAHGGEGSIGSDHSPAAGSSDACTDHGHVLLGDAVIDHTVGILGHHGLEAHGLGGIRTDGEQIGILYGGFDKCDAESVAGRNLIVSYRHFLSSSSSLTACLYCASVGTF